MIFVFISIMMAGGVQAAETGWVMMECPLPNQPCHPQGVDRREPHVYVGRDACLLDIASVANMATSGTRFYCDKITR